MRQGADELRLRVLGRLTVSVGGEDVTPRQERLRSLLGLLLLAGGQGLTTDQLVEALWRGQQQPKRTGALQVGISRLRAWSGERLDGRIGVHRHATTYRVVLDGSTLDAVDFERLLAEAEAAEPGTETQLDLLEQACRLWQGPCLADLSEAVRLAAGVDRWQQRRAAAIRGLVRAASEAGLPQRALDQLRALAAERPLDEPVQAEYVTLLAACGRPAEALMAYEETRALLADELGVDPSPELRDAHLRVLATDARVAGDARPAEDARSAGAPAPGPGPVAAQAVPTGAAAAATGLPESRPRQLPAPIPDFTGRADVLATVVDRLRPSDHLTDGPVRVALTGSAGTGKTALAVQAAQLVSEHFPDGQLFIDLHGGRDEPLDPAEALGRFLRALGVAGSGLPAGTAERADLFRSRTAGRRLLIVLDNIADEAQVRPLLPGDRGCAVLLTGRRRPTALEGVQLIDFGVLRESEAVAMLARFGGVERISREPAEAALIVRYCGRLPLAIRVAAARLANRPGWPLRRLARLLADEQQRLDELTAGDLAVRASIGLSLTGMDASHRGLLGLIGLLDPPDFPAWAAAALLDVSPGDAERMLEELVDARLLDAAGEDPAGQVRYHLHDLVRLFAREQVLAEYGGAQRQEALTRAVRAWSTRAAMAGRNSQGLGVLPTVAVPDDSPPPPAPADPRAWFEAERAAIAAVLAQAVRADLPTEAWRLAAATVGFYDLGSYWDDWLQTHTAALAACRRVGDQVGVATMLWGLGELQVAQDQYDDAEVSLAEAATTFRARGDRAAEGKIQTRLALVHHLRGRAAEAQVTYERAAALLDAAHTGPARAHALRGLGMLHKDQGDRKAAQGYLEEALEIFRREDDQYGLASTLDGLGKAHGYWGEPAVAYGHLTEAADRYAAIGDWAGALHSRVTLGEVLTALDDPGARTLLVDCVAAFRRQQESFGEAIALLALGWAEHTDGRAEVARQTLERSLAFWRSAGVPPLIARATDRLGAVYRSLGEESLAQARWREAAEIFRRIGSPDAERIEQLLAVGDGSVHQ